VSRSLALTKRSIVLAVLAAGIARLALTDAYLAYVKPGMRIPLLVSAAIIFVLALSGATAADDEGAEDGHGASPDGYGHGHDHDHDHDGHVHHTLPRIGYWLLVPVVCMAVVPIFPLGSDATKDRDANAVAGDARLAASPEADDPDGAGVDGGEVTLLDFVSRSINDPANPFPEPVTLVGFVTADDEITDGFVLARFVMSCCAADAQPLLVRIRYDGAVPELDSWVEVTGTHVPAPEDLPEGERPFTRNIVLDADEVVPIDQPAEPYETY
jgi:uncharacterized repeat protein (TIGR03943 family)